VTRSRWGRIRPRARAAPAGPASPRSPWSPSAEWRRVQVREVCPAPGAETRCTIWRDGWYGGAARSLKNAPERCTVGALQSHAPRCAAGVRGGAWLDSRAGGIASGGAAGRPHRDRQRGKARRSPRAPDAAGRVLRGGVSGAGHRTRADHPPTSAPVFGGAVRRPRAAPGAARGRPPASASNVIFAEAEEQFRRGGTPRHDRPRARKKRRGRQRGNLVKPRRRSAAAALALGPARRRARHYFQLVAHDQEPGVCGLRASSGATACRAALPKWRADPGRRAASCGMRAEAHQPETGVVGQAHPANRAHLGSMRGARRRHRQPLRALTLRPWGGASRGAGPSGNT
jgi:hypothetical protein